MNTTLNLKNCQTMNRSSFLILVTLFTVLMLASCKKDAGTTVVPAVEENKEAKAMLQGIWVNDEDGTVVIKVKGDTVIYADSTDAPVAFAIINDSLVMRGYNEMRYAIVKQTEHVFQFLNANGETVKLVKSENEADKYAFEGHTTMTFNQNQLIKRDSVVFAGSHKYHYYVQVNPSKYKVVCTSYNDDGVQVDNVYYDNIINLCVYEGSKRVFSSDIHKQDFKKYVPASYLSQAVLSDITIDCTTNQGNLEFLASVCSPNASTSYAVRLTVTPEGKLMMKGE